MDRFRRHLHAQQQLVSQHLRPSRHGPERIAQPYAADAGAVNPTQVKTDALKVSGLNGLNESAPEAGIGFVSGEVADGARGESS
jgi:hypothetical protein